MPPNSGANKPTPPLQEGGFRTSYHVFQKEGYMSQEQARSQRGAILVELEELQAEIARNNNEVKAITDGIRSILNRLDSAPMKLVWPNEETPIRYQTKDEFTPASLDVARITLARDNMRILTARKEDLERRRGGA